MVERGYLDYYEEKGIIPVRQDVSDHSAHERRRTALYRSLGLTPGAFRGARVLEVGPGSGENAVVTASYGPSYYALVDANHASLVALNDKLRTGSLPAGVCDVMERDFHAPPDSLLPEGSFDIVLAEGCLPVQVDPVRALRKVSRFVSPTDGVLVITTADEVSSLPELCRRLLKPAIMRAGGTDWAQSISVACELFASHLASLPASSRPIEDWVLDQILHPWPAGWSLSITAAIEALPEFQFLGSSPSFATDWRWYKQFADARETWSVPALEQWNSVLAYTLDWRIPAPGSANMNKDLGEVLSVQCREFGRLVHEAWTSDSYEDLPAVLNQLSAIRDVVAPIGGFELTALAIEDFQRGISKVADGDLDYAFEDFRSWWGRGQQYVSFTTPRAD